MGKGDRRTRRGKIYAGSFGKTRPKAGKVAKKVATSAVAKPAAAKKVPAKKKA